MVATKISEVTAKGIEWAYSGSETAAAASSTAPVAAVPPNTTTMTSTIQPPSTAPPPTASSSLNDSSGYGYWTSASESLSNAADATYSSVANAADAAYNTVASAMGYNHQQGSSPDKKPTAAPLKTITSHEDPPSATKKHTDVFWMRQNPYNSVRGRQHHQNFGTSLSAVRSLLTLVPDEITVSAETPNRKIQEQDDSSSHQSLEYEESSPRRASFEATSDSLERNNHSQEPWASDSETASQLAEGTLRAFRDIALDEAVELHDALRFWTVRWERPLLSWWEAGPLVWTRTGYNHKLVGHKVSQIQAVLARRCASLGELQQHLLRAGWHRGVAQWGVLGQGGQWAAVAGFDETTGDYKPAHRRLSSEFDRTEWMEPPPLPERHSRRRRFPKVGMSVLEGLKRTTTSSGNQFSKTQKPFYYANFLVKNEDGGGVYADELALAEWSVDAMLLIRKHLYRASNGTVLIPYEENWAEEEVEPEEPEPQSSGDDGDEQQQALSEAENDRSVTSEEVGLIVESVASTASVSTSERPSRRILPKWVSRVEYIDPLQGRSTRLLVTDLSLMAAEVSALLTATETVMSMQRSRRLEPLRPPNWWQRKWYIVVGAVPALTYFSYKLSENRYGIELVKTALRTAVQFCKEHVSQPMVAIYNELVKGREHISDRKAQRHAISTLKRMIKSWLDETYPTMPEELRMQQAEDMDMTRIEMKKEESMKTFYEITDVIRMSFIEMQFIKKEMMNVMCAMDEVIASNDINMNLAAITPTFIVMYAAKRLFQLFFYATLQLGKSREEVYASFRNVLTDIERLLVMRDNPPLPAPLSSSRRNRGALTTTETFQATGCNVLGSDDLGMLMLHIHECRTILWRERRRFDQAMVASVAEDLAEIAGERGVVSVQQQLQIISRMCRTYPFLKVVSTGTLFEFRTMQDI